jgi:hypothetical protein
MSARSTLLKQTENAIRPATSTDTVTARWPEVRLRALRLIAERASSVAWSPRLLTLLLEELHVDDLFVEIVGRPRQVPLRRAAAAVAIALVLRHSWRADDLTRLVRRLGLPRRPTTHSPTSRSPSVNRSGQHGNRPRVPRR